MLYLDYIKFGDDIVKSANQIMRAHALLINFCPYSSVTIENNGGIHSPFQKLNGFVYRQNWLENLLVASSLRGNWNSNF